jgi:hypothetical protein
MPTPLHEGQDATSMPATEFDAARERLRLVYANLPMTLGGSLATACILAVLLRPVVHPAELVVWLVIGGLLTFARFLNYRRFIRAQDSLEIQAWRTRLEIGAGASGLFWAYACATQDLSV